MKSHVLSVIFSFSVLCAVSSQAMGAVYGLPRELLHWVPEGTVVTVWDHQSTPEDPNGWFPVQYQMKTGGGQITARKIATRDSSKHPSTFFVIGTLMSDPNSIPGHLMGWHREVRNVEISLKDLRNFQNLIPEAMKAFSSQPAIYSGCSAVMDPNGY